MIGFDQQSGITAFPDKDNRIEVSHMYKKITAIALALVFVFSFAACGRTLPYDDYDLDIPNDIHFPAEKAKRLAKLYARSLINKKGYNGQEL